MKVCLVSRDQLVSSSLFRHACAAGWWHCSATAANSRPTTCRIHDKTHQLAAKDTVYVTRRRDHSNDDDNNKKSNGSNDINNDDTKQHNKRYSCHLYASKGQRYCRRHSPLSHKKHVPLQHQWLRSTAREGETDFPHYNTLHYPTPLYNTRQARDVCDPHEKPTARARPNLGTNISTGLETRARPHHATARGLRCHPH